MIKFRFTGLAELWMALEKAGLDPKREFEAMGGGIPRGFENFAVLTSRRSGR